MKYRKSSAIAFGGENESNIVLVTNNKGIYVE